MTKLLMLVVLAFTCPLGLMAQDVVSAVDGTVKKVDAASKVDPSNQADLQKAMFAVQQIQNQMSELVTTATNMLKTQHDTDMSEIRNFA